MEYPSVASLRARRVFCSKPPCVRIAGGADRARRRSTRRKSPLGRGRRNNRRYLSRDHRGYVRGSDQLGGPTNLDDGDQAPFRGGMWSITRCDHEGLRALRSATRPASRSSGDTTFMATRGVSSVVRMTEATAAAAAAGWQSCAIVELATRTPAIRASYLREGQRRASVCRAVALLQDLYEPRQLSPRLSPSARIHPGGRLRGAMDRTLIEDTASQPPRQQQRRSPRWDRVRIEVYDKWLSDR
jgi:hypothetical protein